MQVGCGPVAWAQVFGYFDRRGHEPRGNMGSRQLYRCGSDGTIGNDTCEAPPKMAGDTRIQNYIKKMAQILGSVTLPSSTFPTHLTSAVIAEHEEHAVGNL